MNKKDIFKWSSGLSPQTLPATTAENDMTVGNGAGAWIKKTLAEMIALLAHKNTHDPEDGIDPLDCAAPTELANVQAAGEGSAHSFARSDHQHQVQHSIVNNHIVTIDDANVTVADYAKFTANGLEGRSCSEVRDDLGLQSGTSFPGTPSSGDRYFRTDLGWECYWDGTYWLTMHEYSIGNQITMTANANALMFKMRNDYRWFVTRCAIATYVFTTNEAAHYWTIIVRGTNLIYGGSTSIYTFTTAADGIPGGYALTDHGSDPSAAVPEANRDDELVIYTSKTGSPGDLSIWSQIYWRLIVT